MSFMCSPVPKCEEPFDGLRAGSGTPSSWPVRGAETGTTRRSALRWVERPIGI
jgi:hypothetical protein